ncbi:nuclear transport factor 2 family protein [Mycolicibacterium sp.]|uniref:nuclear transport factor 2 family protein n=1 Tax=Mycolicibacterium sp. TaxID=2320850 RepID=UPI003560779C
MSNIETARAGYKAFAAGDAEGIQRVWADNIHWWSSDEVQPGGEYNGSGAVMQMLGEIPKQWTSMTVEPTEFIEAGDYDIVRGTQTLTNDKGSAEGRFAHIMKFQDGKCVDAEMHADTAKGLKLQG